MFLLCLPTIDSSHTFGFVPNTRRQMMNRVVQANKDHAHTCSWAYPSRDEGHICQDNCAYVNGWCRTQLLQSLLWSSPWSSWLCHTNIPQSEARAANSGACWQKPADKYNSALLQGLEQIADKGTVSPAEVPTSWSHSHQTLDDHVPRSLKRSPPGTTTFVHTCSSQVGQPG